MQYNRTDIKRLKRKPKELKTWTIYLWKEGECVRGAAAVVTKDGLKEIYESACMMDDNTRSEKKNEWMAQNECKKMLTNTLNALNWHGKSVIDSKGNIDKEKFLAKEANAALQAIKHKIGINDIYKIRKFPVKKITAREAFDLQIA